MAVFRINKNANYTVLSNYHFRDKNLSLKAKGLLSLMLSLPEDWDYSIAGLVTLSSDGEASVRSALKEMEKNGYLKRNRVYKDGKIVDWEYLIFENQQVENLDVENQQVGFKAQLNTKELNTKEINKTNSKELVDNFLGSANKPKKKESLYSKCIAMINDFIANHNSGDNIKSLLIQYLNLRLEMADKPMYANQWKGLLNKLEDIHKQGFGYEPIIRQSIEKGYASFYPINTSSTYSKGDMNQGVEIHSEQYTETELEEIHKLSEEREKNGQQAYF